MKFLKTKYGSWLALFLLLSCVEPYKPEVDDRDLNLLVVDAFLNASDASATVTLTRTLPVDSDETVPRETGAFVRIEDDQGNLYVLQGGSEGIYSGPVSNVTPVRKYRLLVTTGASDYQSDFVPVTESPAVDSITYAVLSDGVQFYLTTHDPSNRSRYFRWEYEETYQYNSEFNSVYMFQGNDIVFRPPDQARHTCWKTNFSTDILVGTTKHLEESVMSNFPVSFIPKGSIELTVEYSLLVRQQAITEEAFDYWSHLQKTTEQVGGLFDPLPSEVRGNIHSLNDPEESVLGFFSAGTVQQTRKFVRRSELPRAGIRLFVTHDPSCALDTLTLAELANFPKSGWLVDAIFAPGAGITGYTTSLTRCIDCTLQGGQTTKPDFWK